jgi:O-antigen/teichoic acid export membrane protein
MGQLKQQSIVGFVSSGLGLVLGVVNKLVLFPLFFKDHMAYWGLITTYVAYGTIIGSLASLGAPRAMQRFLPGNTHNREALMSWGLTVAAVGALLTLALMLLFQGSISNWVADDLFGQYFPLLVALVVIMVFLEFANGLLIAHFQPALPIFLNSVALRVGVSVLLGLTFWLDWSPVTFVVLNVALYGLNLVWAWVALQRNRQFVWQRFQWSWPEQTVWWFAGFSIVVGSTGWAINYLDTVFAGAYLTLSAVALLDLAKNFASLMHIPARTIVQASIPLVAQAWNTNNRGMLADIYRRTAITELAVGGAILFALWLNLPWMLALLPLEGAKDLLPVVMVLGLGRLADLATGANSSIIGNSKHYRFSMVSLLVMIGVTSALSVLLAPRLGLLGLAWAMAAGIVVNNALMVLYLWRTEHLHPFGKGHFVFVGYALVMLAIVLANSWLQLSVIPANALALLVTVVYFGWGRPIPELPSVFQRLLHQWKHGKKGS